MAITDTRDMLYYAWQNKFAVCAFEAVDLASLEAILQTAQDLNAPVIVNISESRFDAFQFGAIMAAVEVSAQRSSAPVAIHLIDANRIGSTVRAINSGCNSVTINISDKTFDDNIIVTRQIAATASGCGVPVAGSLPLLPQPEPGQAAEFVSKTNVDFVYLAGEFEADTPANWEMISRINAESAIPLGMSLPGSFDESKVRKAIDSRVSKLDFSREKDIAQCIRATGSAGRGVDIVRNCKPWTPVEHLIIFNVAGISETETRAMMETGKQQLSTIPGVRRVDIGRAVKEGASYQYTWLVRFCHPNVIESYRDHPVHVAFANELFRPVAGDRISIDYDIL